MKEKLVFRKFAMRLIVYTIVPIAIVLLISGEICTSAISRNTKDLVEQQLFEKATGGSNAFSANMSGFIKNIDNETCEEMFEKYFKTISDEENVESSPYYENALSSLDKVWQSSENMLFSFAVAFEKSSFLSSSNAKITQYNYEYTKEAWYNEEAISGEKTYLSQPFIPNIDKMNESNVCVIVKPIMNSMTDEALGVVGICFDLEYLKEMMREKVQDDSGSTILMSFEGSIIYHTDEDKILKNINELVEDKKVVDLSTDKTIKGDEVFEYLQKNGENVINYSIDDKEYIGKVVSNEDAQWLVFSSVSEKEVDERINDIVRPIIIVFLVSLIVLIVIMIHICKKIVKPIVDMANQVKQITDGNYDIELEEKSHDELGELASAFNNTIKTLKQTLTKEKNVGQNEQSNNIRRKKKKKHR